MKDITKYIMGVAAKSNVEKRQVGCVITGKILNAESILAEGFNEEGAHAEVAALNSLATKNSCAGMPEDTVLKAYITHQPCPDCAKQLADWGVTEVEVVEAFMKFDGDKLRYDLIDSSFMCEFIDAAQGYTIDYNKLRGLLYKDVAEATEYLAQSFLNSFELEGALAKILTFGARKYKPGNWKLCTDPGRYLAAAIRHNHEILKGNTTDPETGEHHDFHTLTNLMFLHWFDRQNQS